MQKGECFCYSKERVYIKKYVAAAAKSLQSCPTLCDPIDGSPPGCPIPGILQARTLEWVAISFSNAWKWKVKIKVKSFSRVRPSATPWTAAFQAPPSMGFSGQEYWSGVPSPLTIKFHYFFNAKHVQYLASGWLFSLAVFILICPIILQAVPLWPTPHDFPVLSFLFFSPS